VYINTENYKLTVYINTENYKLTVYINTENYKLTVYINTENYKLTVISCHFTSGSVSLNYCTKIINSVLVRAAFIIVCF